MADRRPGEAGSAAPAHRDIAVELEGVGYVIAGRQILSAVHLQVPRGEIVAIMGMSGSGKTTLLKCIGGLLKPTAGTVAIDGRDIVPLREAEMDAVRLRVGYVFQYAALFDSLTVYENVAFGLVHNRRLSRRELDAIVAQRLDEVEMEGTESLYPRELSGGMQKRVGLARALAIEPAIVLYDEPTSGLDPVIAATIDDLIGRTRARHGVTSIVVSHDVTSVFALADRIAMVHEGTIIALGTPDELRSSGVPEVQRFLERGTAGQAHSRSVDTP